MAARYSGVSLRTEKKEEEKEISERTSTKVVVKNILVNVNGAEIHSKYALRYDLDDGGLYPDLQSWGLPLTR